MSGRTVVVLGAGVGGLVAANELRRMLGRDHRVLLVERNLRHAFAPSFLWLMTGDRKQAQITRDVRNLVRPGIEVIEGEVLAINPADRRVETSAGTLNFDDLIISLGAELAPELIPDLANASHTFFTADGAARLHEALSSFAGGKVAIVISSLPYKCPGAPHEGAMLISDSFRKRGMRNKVDIHLFTPEPLPLPVAGPELGAAVRQMLETKGITFHPSHKLTHFDPNSRELRFEGKETFHCDLLVTIPPHRSPSVVRQSGLANEAGWIPVDRATLETKHPNIYAIGDITAIPLPGRWKPDTPLMLPKAGVFAHAEAQIVARRIAQEIAGTSAQAEFCADGYCMLEAGEDLAGFAFGNFFAEPSPQVQLRKIGKTWHLGKVLFEQWWLAPFGMRHGVLGVMLKLGAKAYGIPLVL
ncbi:MAG: NAD(P)/FAD-dependent oxidoreductase [Acidobacteria bacterium]|jgi:sulfide:quinone oxidoreductase|nr:MAG: NAD(P)/FAD-dependent oxidoreductase [Acidobacteriota bacterium]